jgi:hypothetical protein
MPSGMAPFMLTFFIKSARVFALVFIVSQPSKNVIKTS